MQERDCCEWSYQPNPDALRLRVLGNKSEAKLTDADREELDDLRELYGRLDKVADFRQVGSPCKACLNREYRLLWNNTCADGKHKKGTRDCSDHGHLYDAPEGWEYANGYPQPESVDDVSRISPYHRWLRAKTDAKRGKPNAKRGKKRITITADDPAFGTLVDRQIRKYFGCAKDGPITYPEKVLTEMAASILAGPCWEDEGREVVVVEDVQLHLTEVA